MFFIETAATGLGVYGAGRGGYFVYRARQKLKPEWRDKRLQHFLLKVELESTCSKFGHELNPEYGCEYCLELIKIPAYYWEDHNFYCIDNGGFVDKSFKDQRALLFVETGRDYRQRHGYLWVDPNAKYTKNKYCSQQKALTEAIQSATVQ